MIIQVEEAHRIPERQQQEKILFYMLKLKY